MGDEIMPLNVETKRKNILEYMYLKTKEILLSKKPLLQSIAKSLVIKKELYETDFDELMHIFDNDDQVNESIIDIIEDNKLLS